MRARFNTQETPGKCLGMVEKVEKEAQDFCRRDARCFRSDADILDHTYLMLQMREAVYLADNGRVHAERASGDLSSTGRSSVASR